MSILKFRSTWAVFMAIAVGFLMILPTAALVSEAASSGANTSLLAQLDLLPKGANGLPGLGLPNAPKSLQALTPTPSLAAAGPAVSSLAKSVYSGHEPSWQQERDAAASMFGANSFVLDTLNASSWQTVTNYIWTGGRDTSGLVQETNTSSGLHTDLLGVSNGLITLSGLAIIAVVCAATAGVGCVVAFVVAAILVGLSAYGCDISNALGGLGAGWLCQPNNQNAKYVDAVRGSAEQIIGAFGAEADIQAIAVKNLLNVFNLTTTALGYEAAAQGETQLPNATFNYNLSVAPTQAQGSVAQQLGSEFYADSVTLASIFLTAFQAANFYQGSSNTLPYYCPIYASAGTQWSVPGGLTAGLSGADCNGGVSNNMHEPLLTGSAAPAMIVNLPAAAELGAWDYCPAFYIQNGSSISVASGATLELIPVYDNGMNHTGYINLTFSAYPGGDNKVNFTIPADIPAQGYQICHSGTSALTIWLSFAMPLNQYALAQLPDGVGPGVVLEQPNTFASNAITSYGPSDVVPLTDGVCSATDSGLLIQGFVSSSIVPIFSASIYGGNTNLTENVTVHSPTPNCGSDQLNLIPELLHLQRYAANMSFVYWNFLRYGLGYTSYSQIPIRCQIPNPAQLFPPGSVAVFEGMNTTNLLMWYLAELESLGRTFTLNDTLNATTICNRHITLPDPGNTSIGFGVYATGWIYVPGMGVKSSDGAVAQQFGNPSTWNISGEFYIAPVLNDYTIPVNKTFSLGSQNPVTFFVQPFLKTVVNTAKNTTTAVINRTAPSWCITHSGDGCTTNYFSMFVTGWSYGNSTANAGLTGSVFPSQVLSTPGVSVYITGCYKATNGTASQNATYNYTSTACPFVITTINQTGWFCNGTIEFYNNVPIGTCGGSGGCVLCFQIPDTGACAVVFVSLIAGLLSFLGPTWSCLFAYIITIVIVIVVIYAAVVLVSRQRRSGRSMQG